MKHVLLDTTCLKGTPFVHPDFQKLLRHARDGAIKIYASHIVWEERRTQLVEEIYSKIEKARRAFYDLEREMLGPSSMLVAGLAPPRATVWTKQEVEARSKEAMRRFADENGIEIIELAPDHAVRAWLRYFEVSPPFNGQERDRIKRRQDIPDAWILEAAIDLHSKVGVPIAVCDDGRLSKALQDIGFTVYRTADEFLETLDKAPADTKTSVEEDADAAERSPLDQALERARQRFDGLDTRLLGYIAYLDGPTKAQLKDLASKAGMDVEAADNVIQRLILAGVIEDTGHHYLPRDRKAADLAAAAVESEIIDLLGE